MSEDARNFIVNCLDRNINKRLGAGPTDAKELKDHPFFKNIDWNKLEQHKYKMPKIKVNKLKQNPLASIEF